MDKKKVCWPAKIKGVIFDSDGVLVDTIPIYAMANSEIMGSPYPDSFQLTANGLSEIDFGQRLVDTFHLPLTAQEFVDRRHQILHDHFPEAQLVPGVEKVVRKLHEMGIPMSVATSSDRESHNLKTIKHTDFFNLFKKQICGNEVKKAKPSPEIFQTAAKYLGDFKPEEYLVVEDSVNGIVAANAAGMASVFLTKGFEYGDILEKEKANPSLIISQFDEFDFDAFEWNI